MNFKNAFLIALLVFASAFAPIAVMATNVDVFKYQLDRYDLFGRNSHDNGQICGGDPAGGNGAPG